MSRRQTSWQRRRYLGWRPARVNYRGAAASRVAKDGRRNIVVLSCPMWRSAEETASKLSGCQELNAHQVVLLEFSRWLRSATLAAARSVGLLPRRESDDFKCDVPKTWRQINCSSSLHLWHICHVVVESPRRLDVRPSFSVVSLTTYKFLFRQLCSTPSNQDFVQL